MSLIVGAPTLVIMRQHNTSLDRLHRLARTTLLYPSRERIYGATLDARIHGLHAVRAVHQHQSALATTYARMATAYALAAAGIGRNL
jgi:hypothetical protein